MADLQTRNSFIAVSLQQRLDRLGLKPTEDRVSAHIRPLIGGIATATDDLAEVITMPHNEKNERKLIEEFKSKMSVYHEKLKRHIASLQRETESNRNLLLLKLEEKAELAVHIKDVRSEALSHFKELEKQQKRLKKWKMCYERVFRRLTSIQASFNSAPITDTDTSLDGMRRNIHRLLTENRDLTLQVTSMNDQLKLYEVKLRGIREEAQRSRSLLHAQREHAAASALASSNVVHTIYGGSVTPRVSVGFIEPKGPYPFGEYSTNLEWFFEETWKDPTNGSIPANAYLKSMDDPSQPTGKRILDAAGHEFFDNWKRTQLLFGLSEALQHMASIKDLDKAVKFVMSAICRLCECDRASYWVIDQSRGMAWTKVAATGSPEDRKKFEDPSAMTTLMIPLSTGLVGAAFRSREVLNIADAYADNRFNRTVDQKTEYRTRSVLCYPVVLQGQIVGIVQCINKISPSSSVFSETDIAVVKTLGSAMLGVLSSCHAHEESRKVDIRRQVLVDTTDSLVRGTNCRKHFLLLLRDRMKQLFRADECALILVYKDFYARIALDFDQTLAMISSDRDVTGGIVHKCVSERNPIHVFGKTELGCFDLAAADLEIIKHRNAEIAGLKDGDVSVHAWPIFSHARPGEVSAVIEWACMDRSVIGFGDDGSFNDKNEVHVDLCARLMKLFTFYVEKFWPSKFRLSWTKVKHLQLKVRGMLSFSAAKADKEEVIKKQLRFTPFTNRNEKMIDLWKKAKEQIVSHYRKKMNQPSGSVRKPLLRSADEFQTKLRNERQSIISRRSTITVSPASLEELRAIADDFTGLNGSLISSNGFGNLMTLTEGREPAPDSVSDDDVSDADEKSSESSSSLESDD
jgi:hypothetical protein